MFGKRHIERPKCAKHSRCYVHMQSLHNRFNNLNFSSDMFEVIAQFCS